MSKSNFAWSHPLRTHHLVAMFHYGDLGEYPIDLGQKFYFCPDTLNTAYRVEL